MANFERRSEDKDEVRVFDGGDDVEEGEGSHLPVVIIIAILVLAAFGGVVWLAYNQGVARGRSDVPVRVASTETAGGGQIKVYQQPAGAEDDSDRQAAQPAAPSTASPAPQTPPATAKTETAVAQAAPPATTAKPAPPPAPVATKPPAQLGVAQQPQTSHAAAAPPKPNVPPVALKPSDVSATPPPKPIATAKPASASGVALQIGAYKSQDEAMIAWRTFQSKHSALLAGFSPDVQRADLGDKGVWYRLRVTPFADKAAAIALCDRLKAENGACFLAR